MVGRVWEDMYLNGVRVPTGPGWGQLGPRTERWTHLYLSTSAAVSAELLLMGHVEPQANNRVVRLPCSP